MGDDDAFDRLEEAAENVARRAEWETGNRVGLLWIHVGIGLFAGSQMLAFGSAGNIEALVGVWSRTVLGVLGVLGGLVLALGIQRRKRHRGAWLELEAIGLALLGLWDFLMAVGMAAARIQAGDFSLRALNEPLPPVGTYALPYPISVYLGLFGLICVHLWTLRRFKRGR